MKVAILFFVCLAYASGKVVFPPVFGEYEEGQRFFFMADGNDKIHLVDMEEKMDVEPQFDAFRDTVLFLYTRNNPNNPNVIRNGDFSQFHGSNLDVRKPIKIVIHGWNSDWESAVNDDVTKAFLDNLDVNVIFVDWSEGGATILYPLASARVANVGRFVANLVDWLIANGASMNGLHIMGHSLGGHVSGFAARNVQSGVVPYITAFDPALPLWGSSSDRIRPSDAAYVEIIHTNGGTLGIMDALGDNDFYPNGGTSQTGCGILGISCSHSRSYKFFADSLDHQRFMSTHCNTVAEAQRENCNGSNRIHMGGASPKQGLGIFHLKTNANVPYHQG